MKRVALKTAVLVAINAKPNDGNDETIGLCFMLILPIIALR